MQRASNSLNESPEGRLLALRFGPFELDVRSGELRRNGTTVRLQPQPLKVLLLLAGRPGDVVTREEIQGEIWPAGTFVDFEQSLNFCIRQIRAALRDDANAPRYVETLPRRGYRWVAGPVQSETSPAVVREWPRPLASEPVARPAEAGSGETPAAVGAAALPRALAACSAACAALGLLALGGARALRDRTPPDAPQATPVFQRITFRRGAVNSARFGPDGQVVYSADWDGGGRVLYVARSNPRDSSTLEIKDAQVVGVSAAGEVAFLRGGRPGAGAARRRARQGHAERHRRRGLERRRPGLRGGAVRRHPLPDRVPGGPRPDRDRDAPGPAADLAGRTPRRLHGAPRAERRPRAWS